MKKNKILIGSLLALGALGTLYLIARLLGVIQLYSIPTSGSLPTLNVGSYYWATNLKKPQLLDMVAYKHESPNFGKGIYIHRLVAKAGDVVEIKAGVLYVNDLNIDKNLEIYRLYKLPAKNVRILLDDHLIPRDAVVDQRFNGSLVNENTKVLVTGPPNLFDKIPEAELIITDKNQADRDRFHESHYAYPDEDWNMDYFGPLKIPEGYCFVIGDNLGNSADSRTEGMIKASDIIGVLFKK